MNELKLCIDCKWYHESSCHRFPPRCLKTWETGKIDPVDGLKIMNYDSYCHIERKNFEESCGPGGKYWEKKEPEIKTIENPCPPTTLWESIKAFMGLK